MKNYFIDVESIGLYGTGVLLQYAEGEGDVNLYNLWMEPIQKTLDLLLEFADNNFIGFNNSFDLYKMIQFYTTFEQANKSLRPIDIPFQQFLEMEANGINGGCLKFRGITDLMLIGLQGTFQELLFKKKLTIRKVPKVLAESLLKEISRIEFPDLYFKKYSDCSTRWKIVPIDRDRDFVDVQIKFRPSSKLKDLVEHLGFSKEKVDKFDDLGTPPHPEEFGYRPFGWVKQEDLIAHNNFWLTNKRAREYAKKDVIYTRELFHYLDCPPPNDTNSVLTGMVAVSKWKGFAIDKDKMKTLRQKYISKVEKSEVNFDAPKEVYEYVSRGMGEVEKQIFVVDGKTSCAKEVLEKVCKMTDSVICPECQATELDCKRCMGEGYIEDGEHPSATKAKKVLDARKAGKRVDLIDKFLLAGRFHPTFHVMGTLSSRMSGSGEGESDQNINSQAIPSQGEFKECFPLADVSKGEFTSGADFSGFEVGIAAAKYNDEKLSKLLKTGKKMAGLFGEKLFSMDYDSIMKTAGLDSKLDLYKKGKTGLFGIIYGGQAFTIAKQTGCTMEQAERGYAEWFKEFPIFKEVTDQIQNELALIKTDGKSFRLDLNVKDYSESMLGFKRYFRIEHKIIKGIWDLLQNLPSDWAMNELIVLRKENKGPQKVGNALISALFGFMFSLQSGMIRAAMNHAIQSSGAGLTKELQVRFWDLQPCGYHPWNIRGMQVHDEIISVSTSEEIFEKSKVVVKDFLEDYRKVVPMLEFNWKKLDDWSKNK